MPDHQCGPLCSIMADGACFDRLFLYASGFRFGWWCAERCVHLRDCRCLNRRRCGGEFLTIRSTRDALAGCVAIVSSDRCRRVVDCGLLLHATGEHPDDTGIPLWLDNAPFHVTAPSLDGIARMTLNDLGWNAQTGAPFDDLVWRAEPDMPFQSFGF